MYSVGRSVHPCGVTSTRRAGERELPSRHCPGRQPVEFIVEGGRHPGSLAFAPVDRPRPLTGPKVEHMIHSRQKRCRVTVRGRGGWDRIRCVQEPPS
jgi:hypothetical protein